MCICSEIKDLLVDYLNCGLDQSGSAKVVFHLSACRKCRAEAAFLIRLKNAQAQELGKIPKDIAESAFDLIDAAKEAAQSPIAAAFGALELVGSVLRLAASAII